MDEQRKILGPWEPCDLCVKRFDGDGQYVGLVSYILRYKESDHPLAEVDALIKADGWTLFEDATPEEQAVYVQQRMAARKRDKLPSPDAKAGPRREPVGG